MDPTTIDHPSDSDHGIGQTIEREQEQFVSLVSGQTDEPVAGTSTVGTLESLNRAAEQFGHFFFQRQRGRSYMNAQAEPREQAAAYMNRVLAIIKNHGLGGNVPKKQYDQAVDSVAAIFRRLAPRH
jgi:hypothetical protein